MSKLTLSVPEAAETLGVSRSKMYQLVKSEGFPVLQVGKRILVSVKGLEEWVQEQSKKGWGS